MSLYTDQDLAFIKEHLPKMGATWCAKRLNRHPESLRKKGQEIGVSCPKPHRADEDRNVNPQHLYDIKLSEVAYFLGYFWADGHIHHYRNEKRNLTYHRVAIEVEKADGEHLKRVAETFGRWPTVERQRKRYGVDMKPVLGLVINNEPVYRFLYDHGYDDKSMISPGLILAKIPDHLKPAFWLGFFDGDGSISSRRKSDRHASVYNVQLCGAYEQDWSATESLYKSLGIRYTIRRDLRPNGQKRSIVLIQNQPGIHALYDYVRPFGHLGLPRKQDRFKQFVVDHPKVRMPG